MSTAIFDKTIAKLPRNVIGFSSPGLLHLPFGCRISSIRFRWDHTTAVRFGLTPGMGLSRDDRYTCSGQIDLILPTRSQNNEQIEMELRGHWDSNAIFNATNSPSGRNTPCYNRRCSNVCLGEAFLPSPADLVLTVPLVRKHLHENRESEACS